MILEARKYTLESIELDEYYQCTTMFRKVDVQIKYKLKELNQQLSSLKEKV